MHHFAYRDGVLHAEAVSLDTLADSVGTPFYCYSTATLERHYQVFAGAFADVHALVCYAMKANSNQAVIATLAKLGAGADVVSEGELMRARLAGVPADKIMFSGIGKTARELALAIDEGILCINVESEPELDLLSSIAAGKGRTVQYFGARQSRHRSEDPPQDRHRQGREQVRHPDQPRARGLCASGEAARHQGHRRRHAYRQPDHRSRSVRRCLHAARRVRAHAARRRPHASRHVDLGGGLGIPYLDDNEPPPHPDAYAEMVKRATRDLDCRLIFEPGRLIVGNAGILVTRVLFVKRGEAKNFVIVDAAMNDLIRPTLYEAHHEIWPVAEPARSARRIRADVVGPVCESGDFLALDRDLVQPAPGDLLAVMSAGAYGAVQAGTYNTRPLVPEVLVKGADWAVVRPRLEVDQLIALDRMPDWL